MIRTVSFLSSPRTNWTSSSPAPSVSMTTSSRITAISGCLRNSSRAPAAEQVVVGGCKPGPVILSRVVVHDCHLPAGGMRDGRRGSLILDQRDEIVLFADAKARG